MKEKLLEGFNIHQKHVQVKRVMHGSFEKVTLDPNCKLLQVDFAMAYNCKYQYKIQSALWSCRSVNLFTCATYNAEGKEESFLMVTTSSHKGKNSVCTFMPKLADEITFKDKRELIVYSDESIHNWKAFQSN